MDWIINLFRGLLNFVMLAFCLLGAIVLMAALSGNMPQGQGVFAVLLAVVIVVLGAAVVGVGATLVGIYDRLGELVAGGQKDKAG